MSEEAGDNELVTIQVPSRQTSSTLVPVAAPQPQFTLDDIESA
jgi:hypothetical protein